MSYSVLRVALFGFSTSDVDNVNITAFSKSETTSVNKCVVKEPVDKKPGTWSLLKLTSLRTENHPASSGQRPIRNQNPPRLPRLPRLQESCEKRLTMEIRTIWNRMINDNDEVQENSGSGKTSTNVDIEDLVGRIATNGTNLLATDFSAKKRWKKGAEGAEPREPTVSSTSGTTGADQARFSGGVSPSSSAAPVAATRSHHPQPPPAGRVSLRTRHPPPATVTSGALKVSRGVQERNSPGCDTSPPALIYPGTTPPPALLSPLGNTPARLPPTPGRPAQKGPREIIPFRHPRVFIAKEDRRRAEIQESPIVRRRWRRARRLSSTDVELERAEELRLREEQTPPAELAQAAAPIPHREVRSLSLIRIDYFLYQ
ncbi:hypothetical protein DMENIID0001_023960 [Sergentomyia squamirostris]